MKLNVEGPGLGCISPDNGRRKRTIMETMSFDKWKSLEKILCFFRRNDTVSFKDQYRKTKQHIKREECKKLTLLKCTGFAVEVTRPWKHPILARQQAISVVI